MFDNLLMSMNSKLKKIMSGLETNEGKIDEISTDVGSVGTSVATVQSTSDEIKALIGTEIATQLSALEANVIAAMPSGSSGLTSCIRKIQRGTTSITANEMSVSVTLSGFSNVNKMFVILDGMSYLYDGSSTAYNMIPYLKSLTVSKLTLGHSDDPTSGLKTFSYQVIEFY